MSGPFIQKRVDDALNEIIAERDTVLRLPRGAAKSARLADLFEREADLWSELYDGTTSTTQARAAIRARQYARMEAARLRSQVSAQPTSPM